MLNISNRKGANVELTYSLYRMVKTASGKPPEAPRYLVVVLNRTVPVVRVHLQWYNGAIVGGSERRKLDGVGAELAAQVEAAIAEDAKASA